MSTYPIWWESIANAYPTLSPNARPQHTVSCRAEERHPRVEWIDADGLDRVKQ